MKYYIVNTNRKANPEGQDEAQMLKEEIVSLYFDGHKEHINKLNTGDVVFLYSNEFGVIACGEVSGKTLQRDYKGLVKFKNEEYYQKFKSFYKPKHPITVKEMKAMFGKRPLVMKSMNPLTEVQGVILFDFITHPKAALKTA